MNQGPPLANAPRVVRILHTALLGGLTLCGATLYLVRRLSQPPPPPVGEARVLTLVLVVVSVGVLVIAVGMLRPRVPERRSEQNPEAYCTDASSRAAAIVLWAAIEGQVWSVPSVISSPQQPPPWWRTPLRWPRWYYSGRDASKGTEEPNDRRNLTGAAG